MTNPRDNASMRNHDIAMWAYVELADLSQRRGQIAGCDRFLVLAGVAACRAGCPDVAARCHELVQHHNVAHITARWPSFAAALHDDDFTTFLIQLERFCPLEKAEHLLHELDITFPNEEADTDIASRLVNRLQADHWK